MKISLLLGTLWPASTHGKFKRVYQFKGVPVVKEGPLQNHLPFTSDLILELVLVVLEL